LAKSPRHAPEGARPHSHAREWTYGWVRGLAKDGKGPPWLEALAASTAATRALREPRNVGTHVAPATNRRARDENGPAEVVGQLPQQVAGCAQGSKEGMGAMRSGAGDLERFLSTAEVCRITSLSRSTVYRLARRGMFPRPVQLTTNRSAFIQSEVARWVAERTAEADDAAHLRAGSRLVCQVPRHT
jgi:prophage regulatory protein